MTKNAVAKNWSWDGGATGTGGTYNSNQPLGLPVVLTINGTNLFGPPEIVNWSKWTDGGEGDRAALDSPEIGAFDTGHYSTGTRPNYFTLDGTTGVGIREGTVGFEVGEENYMTGFSQPFANSTKYFMRFDMGVPVGRTYAGAASPYELPFGESTIKMGWITDNGKVGTVGSASDGANNCMYSWAGGTGVNISGNEAPPSPFPVEGRFTFDKWNGYAIFQQAGANPAVDNGLSEMAISIPDVETNNQRKTDAPIFIAGSPNQYYNRMHFPAWSGNADQTLTLNIFRYYYLAIGANAEARVELGDSAIYDECSYLRMAPHDTWSTGQIKTLPIDNKQRRDMTHVFVTIADGTDFGTRYVQEIDWNTMEVTI